MKRVVTGCATPGYSNLVARSQFQAWVLASIGITPFLVGCTHTVYLDKPSVVTVPVPVTKLFPTELLTDCPAAPLLGTSVGSALNRLASVEACLAQLRHQLQALRDLNTPIAPNPPP